jgi:ribosomal protein S27E
MTKSKSKAEKKPKTRFHGVRCNSCKYINKADLWCTLLNCRKVLHNPGCERHEKPTAGRVVKPKRPTGAQERRYALPGLHGKPKQATTKTCLKCGKEFIRPVGSNDWLCSRCHASNERTSGSMANPEPYGML